ncbi:MAG: hypothetical protein IT290_04105 [Deltaproteobacteria bacterium]|nr:hypothetical protein [Deltaproteobacteria bacterium]
MSENAPSVEQLIQLARRALELPVDEAASLVAALEDYLQAFDSWQLALSGTNPLAPDSPLSESERDSFRSSVQQLETLHRAVLELAQNNRDRVYNQMGGVRKRAQALRAYIDKYPSRITIAGKREG